jgi:hypothetical protein
MCNIGGVLFNETVIVCMLRSVARRRLAKTKSSSARAMVNCKWCR